MTSHALQITGDDLTAALTAALAEKSLPLLLHDVLETKMKRGDTDCRAFKAMAKYQFGVGLNATVESAAEALRQWARKGLLNPSPELTAFVRDIQDFDAGKYGRAA